MRPPGSLPYYNCIVNLTPSPKFRLTTLPFQYHTLLGPTLACTPPMSARSTWFAPHSRCIVPSLLLDPPRAYYRNFNICPHCEWWGEDPTLSRMSESMPMISRSDGRNFHLLLADRPLAYPAERDTGSTEKLSVCFWYSHVGGKTPIQSTIVLLPGLRGTTLSLFRQIEFIADLLATELMCRQSLAGLYDLQGNSLHEISY